ncbi:MAG: addiction module protein [bacterium]|nr:addiction module protein [bacterium]
MTTNELLAKAVSLPVEERAIIADSALCSLNAPDSGIDRKWAQVTQRRLTELRSGQVKAIPAEHFFAAIWKRFDT